QAGPAPAVAGEAEAPQQKRRRPRETPDPRCVAWREPSRSWWRGRRPGTWWRETWSAVANRERELLTRRGVQPTNDHEACRADPLSAADRLRRRVRRTARQ